MREQLSWEMTAFLCYMLCVCLDYITSIYITSESLSCLLIPKVAVLTVKCKITTQNISVKNNLNGNKLNIL